MKKIVLAVMVLTIFSVQAQQRKQHEGPRDHRADLNPEQMATLQTKKMTLALDLTAAQQKDMQQLHLENARFHEEKKASRKSASEDEVRKKPSAEERYNMANARLDHMIAQKAKVKQILSEDQYQKWEKAHRGKRRQHKHEKMHKRQRRG